MTIEIVTIVPHEADFVIAPVKEHPLPDMRSKSPQEVAQKLANHFETAIKEGHESWLAQDTVLVVEMPGGASTEIAFEPPALNA